jgi:opacity protein-like surface antigen
MKRLLRSFAACLALFWALPAAAQVDDYARNGPYLGLAGTWASYVDADGVDDPLGLNVRAGYRFHPHIAGELEFEWLSEADIENTGLTLESFAFTANGKLYPLTGRLQPFGVIGLGLMNAEVSSDAIFGGSEDETEFAMRFGAGLDFYFTRNFLGSLDFSYVLPTGDLDEVDYIRFGWGFGYRF